MVLVRKVPHFRAVWKIKPKCAKAVLCALLGNVTQASKIKLTKVCRILNISEKYDGAISEIERASNDVVDRGCGDNVSRK